MGFHGLSISCLSIDTVTQIATLQSKNTFQQTGKRRLIDAAVLSRREDKQIAAEEKSLSCVFFDSPQQGFSVFGIRKKPCDFQIDEFARVRVEDRKVRVTAVCTQLQRSLVFKAKAQLVQHKSHDVFFPAPE